jgi:hypothetical protein
LQVVTNGAINLFSVQAHDNYLYGAQLKGTDVNIGFSSFNSNGTDVLSDHIGKGLEIESTGSGSLVSLFEVTANDNQLFGAKVKADGLVLINNSVFSGNKSYTYSSCKGKNYDGYGLQVVTTSDIYLDSVTANDNHLYGASLSGAYVEVSNSFFSFNSSGTDKSPTGKGLEVNSSSDVLLRYVEANNNQLFGATIQADGQVKVLSSVFATNKYYTYSSCKGTKGAGYGLKVVAAGPITLGSDENDVDNRGVQAYDNGAEGAILQGETTVNVSDSSFNNNGSTGLLITANDNVTLTNVIAMDNGGDGVNVTGMCTNEVSVYGSTFAKNSKYGIKVLKATYSPDGTQTFFNNGSGNVFQSSSGCASSASSSGSSQSNGHWHGWHWSHHGR